VHPQFTEPDVALTAAGHRVHRVLLDSADGFALDPDQVPAAADLVVLGNPTNPTGVRHPEATIRRLLAPDRLVVVDEAFLDDGVESLASAALPGLVVVRSLTKLWSVPGVRAGHLLGETDVVAGLAQHQAPWSVSAQAVAALVACSTPEAVVEAKARDATIAEQRAHLESGLARLGVDHVISSAPFVLARPGEGVHALLRQAGFAVRRADTFPGLDASWVRIAVRPQPASDALLTELERVLGDVIRDR